MAMKKNERLTSGQRAQLLEWLAADYDVRMIRGWFASRGWPSLSDQVIAYYRKSRDVGIQTVRARRNSEALMSGLALKEERVIRLKKLADEIEMTMWYKDDDGKMQLSNSKVHLWRGVLSDIAAEMGDRKFPIEHSWREIATSAGIDPDALVSEFFEKFTNGKQENSNSRKHPVDHGAGGERGGGEGG